MGVVQKGVSLKPMSVFASLLNGEGPGVQHVGAQEAKET